MTAKSSPRKTKTNRRRPPDKSTKQFAPANTWTAPPSSPTAAAPQLPKFIGRAQVEDMVNKTYPVIWGLVKKGLFPRPRNNGGKNAWLLSEVEQWMQSRPHQFWADEEPPSEGCPW